MKLRELLEEVVEMTISQEDMEMMELIEEGNIDQAQADKWKNSKAGQMAMKAKKQCQAKADKFNKMQEMKGSSKRLVAVMQNGKCVTKPTKAAISGQRAR